jgi:hypothetical protein
MGLDTEDIQRITIEETLGKRTSEEPDTEEQAKFRREVSKGIAEMRRDGVMVDVPNE